MSKIDIDNTQSVGHKAYVDGFNDNKASEAVRRKKSEIDRNKDMLVPYDPANPHYMPTGENSQTPKKDYLLKIEHGGNDYFVREKSPEEKEKMRTIANKISLCAREEIDLLIEEYKRKLENANTELDHMAYDAQLLWMLQASRGGAAAQELAKIADMNCIIIRDQTRDEYNSKLKIAAASATGALMIFGSVVAIAGVFGAIDKANCVVGLINKANPFGGKLPDIKDGDQLVKIGKSMSGIGQGVQSSTSYLDNSTQAKITYLNVNQQRANQESSLNTEAKRRSDQMEQTAKNTAAEIRKTRNTTFTGGLRQQ